MLDIWAVYWKEWKGLFSQGNRQMLVRLLMMVAPGIWMPIQAGSQWFHVSLFYMLFFAFFPVFFVFSFVADVFAGERERHTLETLLASRLPDWSIVTGKGASLVTQSWGTTILSLLISNVVANVVAGGHTWTFYPVDQLLIVLFLGLTTSLLAVAVGILVSLRASTVRQAQQILVYGLLGLGLVVGLLITQINNLPFLAGLENLSGIQLLLLLSVSIAVVDILLVGITLARFQRSRLITN